MEHFLKGGGADGLGEVVVHAGLKAALAVSGDGVGGEGDDDGATLGGEDFADAAGGLEAIHNGHLAVHEDDVVGVKVEEAEGLLAIGCEVAGVAGALEEGGDELGVNGIVLGDEDAGGGDGGGRDRGSGDSRGISGGEDGGEEAAEGALHDGLGGDGGEEVAVWPAAGGDSADGGEEDDFHLGEAGEGDDLAGEVDAMHAGHLEIGEDEMEGRSGGGEAGEGLGGGDEGLDLGLPAGEEAGDDFAVDGVVIDNHDAEAGREREVGGRGGDFLGDGGEWEGEPEAAAAAGLAVDADFSAHALDEAFADGEAEAAAAVGAGVGIVDLAEGLEDFLLLVLGDADAGIRDLEAEPDVVAGHFDGLDAADDLAAVGEFDGVCEEIDEDLAGAVGIAAEVGGGGGMDEEAEGDVLGIGAGAGDEGDFLGEGGQVEGLVSEVDLVCLDLGEVQDVIDKAEEGLAGGMCHFRHVALFGIQPGAEEELVHADDAIEGGPDFVAHIRQELGLEA